jgi:ABC-2 type transport system ATP-binding protein
VSQQKERVRNDIGIVFQESTLDGKLTIEENLKLHCAFYNVPKSEVDERIRFALNLVELESRRKSSIESLSGGMKRRAEIARGLVHFPKILFLDEPTTGLDPQTRANVWEYILKLQKQKNMTIFLTTHYMEEAEVCDKVAVIDKGKIVAHDTPFNLKKKYTSTKMRLETTDTARLTAYLEAQHIRFVVSEQIVTAFTNGFEQVYNILSANKNCISDIELNKGSLNDVFIAITGKEIRE